MLCIYIVNTGLNRSSLKHKFNKRKDKNMQGKFKRALNRITRVPTDDEKSELIKSEERLWECQAEILDILEHLG